MTAEHETARPDVVAAQDPGTPGGPRRSSARWQAFRSLSRAMFRGFARDRAAMFFSILFPVMFLLLFGSIYKSSSTPRINVVEVGPVSVLDQARTASHGQLDRVLKITRRACLAGRSLPAPRSQPPSPWWDGGRTSCCAGSGSPR
jgi:hypothetical protein